MSVWFWVRWSVFMVICYAVAAFSLWDAGWLFNLGYLTPNDRGGIAFSIIAAAVAGAVFSMMMEI